MIAVDTSALLAITFQEPERESFLEAIQRADRAILSTVTLVEACMVIHGRRGRGAVLLLDELLEAPVFEVAPPGLLETELAYAAFAKYGKGTGHPAKLNLGDLFSYALAKSRGLPLLYKGNDFAATDVVSALR